MYRRRFEASSKFEVCQRKSNSPTIPVKCLSAHHFHVEASSNTAAHEEPKIQNGVKLT